MPAVSIENLCSFVELAFAFTWMNIEHLPFPQCPFPLMAAVAFTAIKIVTSVFHLFSFYRAAMFADHFFLSKASFKTWLRSGWRVNMSDLKPSDYSQTRRPELIRFLLWLLRDHSGRSCLARDTHAVREQYP